VERRLGRYRQIERRWAGELYELDEHATYRLLAAGEMAGRTGANANSVMTNGPFLWGWLAEIRALLDEAERLNSERGIFSKENSNRLSTIFNGPAVELRRSEIPAKLPRFIAQRLVDSEIDDDLVLLTIDTLVDVFRAVYEPLREVVESVDAVWRDLMPRIDAAEVSIVKAESTARRLLMTLPEVRLARQRLDAVKSAVSDDPLSLASNVGNTLDKLVADAARAAGKLDKAHGSLDEDTDAMAAILADLRVVRARAAAAYSEAEAKIAPSTPLKRVPSTAVIDGPNGLAHRAAQLADAERSWQDRRREVDKWHHTAQRLRTQLDAALETNSAAIVRRNEMRGLLRAYRSKAAMMPDLADEVVGLGDAAHEELFTSPSDLGRAQELIAKFSAGLSA